MSFSAPSPQINHYSISHYAEAQYVDNCEDAETDVRDVRSFNVSFVTAYINSMANEDFAFWLCLLIVLIIFMYALYCFYTTLTKTDATGRISGGNKTARMRVPVY